jgi:hypothetical protein
MSKSRARVSSWLPVVLVEEVVTPFKIIVVVVVIVLVNWYPMRR